MEKKINKTNLQAWIDKVAPDGDQSYSSEYNHGWNDAEAHTIAWLEHEFGLTPHEKRKTANATKQARVFP